MLKKQNVFEGYASAKDVAAKIAESHDINDPIIKKLDINDMGFINISLTDSLIETEINTILKGK